MHKAFLIFSEFLNDSASRMEVLPAFARGMIHNENGSRLIEWHKSLIDRATAAEAMVRDSARAPLK